MPRIHILMLLLPAIEILPKIFAAVCAVRILFPQYLWKMPDPDWLKLLFSGNPEILTDKGNLIQNSDPRRKASFFLLLLWHHVPKGMSGMVLFLSRTYHYNIFCRFRKFKMFSLLNIKFYSSVFFKFTEKTTAQAILFLSLIKTLIWLP